jgi:hypothetical protein
MKTVLAICSFLVTGFSARSQYTYFSNLYQEGDGTHFEASSAIECRSDTIVVFGVWNEFSNISHLTRKTLLTGELVEMKLLENPSDILPFLNGANAFNILPDSTGYLWTGAWLSDKNRGKMIRFDTDMDTLWTKTFDLFGERGTRLNVNLFVSDGIIVIGEDVVGGTDEDSDLFILKTDFEGNYLWHQIVNDTPKAERAYSACISDDGGYILAGYRYFDYDGVVTKTNELGEFEWEISLGTDEYHDPAAVITETSNGNYIAGWGLSYDLEIPQNEYSYIDSIMLTKFTSEAETLWQKSYYSRNNGAVNDIEVLSDGSMVVLGTYYNEFEGQDIYGTVSFLMKVDDEGNEQWYHEYYYDVCVFCESRLYDLELTSDGGFAMVGVYFGGEEDFYDHTWLLKVDGCGCTEDCGCPPVGVEGLDHPLNIGFRMWPNPSSGNVFISIQGSNEIFTFEIRNALGQIVQERPSHHHFAMDLQNLHPGMYLVDMKNSDGQILLTQKLMIR